MTASSVASLSELARMRGSASDRRRSSLIQQSQGLGRQVSANRAVTLDCRAEGLNIGSDEDIVDLSMPLMSDAASEKMTRGPSMARLSDPMVALDSRRLSDPSSFSPPPFSFNDPYLISSSHAQTSLRLPSRNNLQPPKSSSDLVGRRHSSGSQDDRQRSGSDNIDILERFPKLKSLARAPLPQRGSSERTLWVPTNVPSPIRPNTLNAGLITDCIKVALQQLVCRVADDIGDAEVAQMPNVKEFFNVAEYALSIFSSDLSTKTTRGIQGSSLHHAFTMLQQQLAQRQKSNGQPNAAVSTQGIKQELATPSSPWMTAVAQASVSGELSQGVNSPSFHSQFSNMGLSTSPPSAFSISNNPLDGSHSGYSSIASGGAYSDSSESGRSARSSSSVTSSASATKRKKNRAGRPPVTSPSAQHVCPYQGCGEAFKTRFSLKRHEKKHTGHRPYACEVKDCGKRFSEKSTLKRHMRVHTKEKPFVCAIPGCGRMFADRINAKRHTQSHAFGLNIDSSSLG